MREQQAIEYLRQLRSLTRNDNQMACIVNAVYISPAQQLRNSADEIERKEKLLAEIDQFLSTNLEG